MQNINKIFLSKENKWDKTVICFKLALTLNNSSHVIDRQDNSCQKEQIW